MISFRRGAAFGTLRKAAAFIVKINADAMETWHHIDVVKDLCNLIAGYDENSSNMSGVDVPMLEDVFNTKPPGLVCMSYMDMLFGEDIGCFLHLKLGNGKVTHIACSKSSGASLIFDVQGAGARRLKDFA